MLIIEFHIFYVMLWIPLLISLCFFKTEEEEFQKLNIGLRFYYRLFPYLCMLLIYLYPFMHAEVFTDSHQAFIIRVGFLLIGATYINVMSLLIRKSLDTTFWVAVLVSVGYLGLMVGWNIYVHSSVFRFIINMVLAVVAILPMLLIATFLAALAVTRTKEQREADAEVEERRKQILARQAAERQAQEALERKRQEERNERDRQITLELHRKEAEGKVPPRPKQIQWSDLDYDWDSGSSGREKKGFWDRFTDSYASTDRASGGNCCKNCSYFRGGCCRNPASDANGQTIYSPASQSCMFHNM